MPHFIEEDPGSSKKPHGDVSLTEVKKLALRLVFPHGASF